MIGFPAQWFYVILRWIPASVDHWRGWGRGVRTFNDRVASNLLLCTYDICSTYRKLISVMCSLFLISVIMFFQTIINLLLLKSYYKILFLSLQCFGILFVLNYMVWLCRLAETILNIIIYASFISIDHLAKQKTNFKRLNQI